MTAPVAIVAIGNRSRGDDAVGPLLLDWTREWLDAAGRAQDFALFEEYQLQVENALDLEGRRVVLFIDAEQDAGEAVRFSRVAETAALGSHSSHELSPGAVLGVYRQVTGREPPPAFALGIAASDFELGAPLTPACREAMAKAWERLQALLVSPHPGEWQTMADHARS